MQETLRLRIQKLYDVNIRWFGVQPNERVLHLLRFVIILIQNLKAKYEFIEVTGVVGNHGRTTDNYKSEEPVENNFEYHIYKILQMIFEKDNRVKVNVPNTRQYIVKVAGWRHLLQDGDTFRGSTKNYIE